MNKRDLEGVQLLIVEDDQNSSRLLTDFLNAKGGAMIKHAVNGSDAIAMARQDYFDVILVDLRLPGENGFMVTENIKRSCNRTPSIIVVSAFSDKQNRIRAFESGADAFFSKPIDLKELFLIIKNFSMQKKKNVERTISMLEQMNQLGEDKLHRSGHSEEVKAFCKILGEINEIDQSLFPLLTQGAAFHDLGLVYDDQPGISHGEIAADLIERAGLSSDLATLVRFHHQFQMNINSVIENPQLGTALQVLQQAEKTLEVYPSSPEEFQMDIDNGFLNPEVSAYIQDRLRKKS